MPALWQVANPADHDYIEERWDYARDGYLKVFVHTGIRFNCGLCGRNYPHFFVSHADWAKVPRKRRGKRLCVDCYVANAAG